MKYAVALVPTEEGYSVSCPGLPGCWSQGATEEEALANIQDAIREYLETRPAGAKDYKGFIISKKHVEAAQELLAAQRA